MASLRNLRRPLVLNPFSKNNLTIVARRNRARVEALFSSIGEGAIATDERGRITRVNQVALDMLGYTISDVLHKRLTTAIKNVRQDGSPVPVAETAVAKVYLSGRPVEERTAFKRKNGPPLPVQVTTAPIMFKKQPIGAIVVFRDLTHELEMERLKSDFISVASHQLRTPLSSINIYAKMLEDGMAGRTTKRQQEFLKIILSSTDRMNELISTLLNITRIEAGGVKVRASTVSLARLVRDMLVEIEPALNAKQLNLSVEIAKGVPSLKTDNLLAKEVIANLLSNAIKYTPQGGDIKVRLGCSTSAVIFSVEDSGCGIPATAKDYIFTKFFRADNAVAQDANGTGLGLYLTRVIAKNLGGKVWFESAMDEGSKFYFSLPRRSPALKAAKLNLGS